MWRMGKAAWHTAAVVGCLRERLARPDGGHERLRRPAVLDDGASLGEGAAGSGPRSIPLEGPWHPREGADPWPLHLTPDLPTITVHRPRESGGAPDATPLAVLPGRDRAPLQGRRR